jgi:hypothetical protein
MNDAPHFEEYKNIKSNQVIADVDTYMQQSERKSTDQTLNSLALKSSTVNLGKKNCLYVCIIILIRRY